MQYDLDRLERHCRGLAFETARPSANRLEVTVLEGIRLVVENLADGSDTIIGFEGTPWHFHGGLTLRHGSTRYVELDECGLFSALRDGEVVVVERFVGSALQDRWVAHRLEPLDVEYVEPDEELRVHRLPLRTSDPLSGR